MLTDVPTDSAYEMFILCGNKVILRSPDLANEQSKVLMPYSPHSMWNDRDAGRVLFASAQSGGSAIHIVNTAAPYWIQELRDLDPPGKLRDMRENYTRIRAQVGDFVRPAHERVPDQWVEASGNSTHPVSIALREKYNTVNPLFMSFAHTTNVQDQSWKANAPITRVEPVVDPSEEPHLNRFDNGITYGRTQQELLDDHYQPVIDASLFGLSFRAGHGNDPYYYDPETLKKAIDASYAKDPTRTTVLSWAEIQSTSDDYVYPLDRLFYEVADHLRPRNGIMSFNNKHIFWNSTIHKSVWSDFVAGRMRSVFSSCMEESTSKTAELSLAGRIGLWASGSFDRWGTRTTRDNTSFDRSREIAAQIVPNHFLRHMIYRLAYGARFSHSSYTDSDYQSLAWELVTSGALYFPRREEIVSFSPVHLSMKTDPDERYIGFNQISKWLPYYDEAEQEANPMVIGRMEACWLGGANTEWDFSRYAAGVGDRRQNFIPPYPHGMVLMTPVETGIFASRADYRNRLVDNIHPIYRDILTEVVTDGREYWESDGSMSYAANSDYFYNTVKPALEAGASQLPISLSGDPVGWVCAQSAPNHLRLTLIDSGYLSPEDRTVVIQFNTVTPLVVKDILSGETYPVVNGEATVQVPLGMFKLLDIEISEPLKSRWDTFVEENGLSGDLLADTDGDSVADFVEYSTGGDPLLGRPSDSVPTYEIDGNQLKVRSLQLKSSPAVSGVRYEYQWTHDLNSGIWNNHWDSETTVDLDASLFNLHEMSVSIENHELFFIRLKLMEP
ncbi:MAG: hypothetical protein ACPGN3_17645 [Opitutales bacterium]